MTEGHVLPARTLASETRPRRLLLRDDRRVDRGKRALRGLVRGRTPSLRVGCAEDSKKKRPTAPQAQGLWGLAWASGTTHRSRSWGKNDPPDRGIFGVQKKKNRARGLRPFVIGKRLIGLAEGTKGADCTTGPIADLWHRFFLDAAPEFFIMTYRTNRSCGRERLMLDPARQEHRRCDMAFFSTWCPAGTGEQSKKKPYLVLKGSKTSLGQIEGQLVDEPPIETNSVLDP